MSLNFEFFLSSPCPSIIKMRSLWSCKNASNEMMISVPPEGGKIVTFTS